MIFKIGLQSVCQICFIKVFGISKKLIYSDNQSISKLCYLHESKINAINFLTKLSENGNIVPDCNEIHLDYNSKKNCL